MSPTTTPPPTPSAPAASKSAARNVRRRVRGSSDVLSLLAQGEPFIWLTGGALILCLVMILALLALVASLGLSTFRPSPLLQLQLHDGRTLLGEVTKTESFDLTTAKLLSEPQELRDRVVQQLTEELSDGLAGLTQPMQQSQAEHDRQIADLQQRVEETQQRWQRLVENTTDGTLPPFSRRDEIAQIGGDEALVKTRNELESLQRRIATLQQEQQQIASAVQYFDQPQHQTLDALRSADPETQAIGLSALLQRVANERGAAAVQHQRQMLRTGNYELTNEHFQWVTDYEIAPSGSSYPELATTVERISWGRFYGIPQKFTMRQQRVISQSEQQLEQMVEFLRQHRDRIGTADPERLDHQLQNLERELLERRVADVKTFLAMLPQPSESSPLSQLETRTGELHPAKELDAQDEITAAIMTWDGAYVAWQQFTRHHANIRARFHQQQQLEKHDLGKLYAQQERDRLRVRQAELDTGLSVMDNVRLLLESHHQTDQTRQEQTRIEGLVDLIHQRFGDASPAAALAVAAQQEWSESIQEQRQSHQETIDRIDRWIHGLPPDVQTAVQRYVETERTAADRSSEIQAEIESLKQENAQYQLHMVTADGQTKSLAVADIVRAYLANATTRSEKAGIYLSRWWEFLVDEPREANSEGGVLPAIWGTVTMTLIMSLAVVPFGVLASLYLREYAKSGVIISAIRIAINNLAGVPSIVFGVFGLGFFCYIIGAYLDGGPRNAGFQPLPPPRWYALSGFLAVGSLVAFLTGLFSLTGRHSAKSTWKRGLGYGSLGLWFVSLSLLCYLLIKTPLFNGFYEANLPNPYWGKGGVLWAALTLALMTLPVVIVATEEALSAVPNSMREGSYGCGASKWQTIRRIVLPQALPGIMTGMILAMARGAGEVAPLMLVGAVKMAPELPLDTSFPYLHGNRSFMHLGFHIFDVGFQSQNSEAAKPMVYTTTLLLIVIITLLNLMAVQLRAYLRKRFLAGQF